jgi:hypothetical protein
MHRADRGPPRSIELLQNMRRPCHTRIIPSSKSRWVESQSATRALVQRLLEGLPGGVARDRGQLAVDLGLVCRWHGGLCGDAAAWEPVEAGGLKARCLAVDPR